MRELRQFTMARVGLGRTGNSVPTRELLDFQLAHARARDAVHGLFDPRTLAAEVEAVGLGSAVVSSAARNRFEYLRRPDLGRRLDESSAEAVRGIGGPFDVIFIVADGLSPLAVETSAVPLLRLVTSRLIAEEWRVAPVVIAMQGRVALGDEIGSIVQASLSVMLIGERPGQSSVDSIGAYQTWGPRPGRTDAERNCISNSRPAGLTVGAASELLLMLMREARGRRLSGVGLKAREVGRLE